MIRFSPIWLLCGLTAISSILSSCSAKPNPSANAASPSITAMLDNSKNIPPSSASPVAKADTLMVNPTVVAVSPTVAPTPIVTAIEPTPQLQSAQFKGKNQLTSVPKSGKEINLQKLNPAQKLALSKNPETTQKLAVSCPKFPCLILSKGIQPRVNKYGNPVYQISAYNRSSTPIFTLNAVTGRSNTQQSNRYQSGTHAPLPDGQYSVTPRVEMGTLPEVGGTIIPILPQPGFDRRMSRKYLGIHWDPSFNKDFKEDGTSGCIGLTQQQDYFKVRDFVLKYHPQSLQVKIN